MIFNGSKLYHHVTNSARDDKTALRCTTMAGRRGWMPGRGKGFGEQKERSVVKKAKI
jgi:hypothetical protein